MAAQRRQEQQWIRRGDDGEKWFGLALTKQHVDEQHVPEQTASGQNAIGQDVAAVDLVGTEILPPPMAAGATLAGLRHEFDRSFEIFPETQRNPGANARGFLKDLGAGAGFEPTTFRL